MSNMLRTGDRGLAMGEVERPSSKLGGFWRLACWPSRSASTSRRSSSSMASIDIACFAMGAADGGELLEQWDGPGGVERRVERWVVEIGARVNRLRSAKCETALGGVGVLRGITQGAQASVVAGRLRFSGISRSGDIGI
jgi:hypothetical protein